MRGYLELLVPLYNSARPSSALHLATTAVALAASGAYPGRQDLLQEAAAAYGKALRKLKEDLQDPAMAKSNENVLATLLFSLYEVSRLISITSARSSVASLPFVNVQRGARLIFGRLSCRRTIRLRLGETMSMAPWR